MSIEEIIRRIVREELELAFAGKPSSTHYSTSKRGPHIPGKSLHWHRAHVKQMPGAKRVGGDWIISIANFDAWADARARERRPSSRALAPASRSDEEDERLAKQAVDEWAAANNYRYTRPGFGRAAKEPS